MLSRNGDTNLYDSMGALHSRHKPRGLKALSTTRQAPQRRDRQEGEEGLRQAEKAMGSPLHLGVRAEAEQMAMENAAK